MNTDINVVLFATRDVFKLTGFFFNFAFDVLFHLIVLIFCSFLASFSKRPNMIVTIERNC